MGWHDHQLRTTHNGLTSVDNGSPGMAQVLDRMRRRQVRYCWQLAAELRAVAPLAGVICLTPEDPADTSATELLNRQAADVARLAADGHRRSGPRRVDGGQHQRPVPRADWSESATSHCLCTTTSSFRHWPGSSASWPSVGWMPAMNTRSATSWWGSADGHLHRRRTPRPLHRAADEQPCLRHTHVPHLQHRHRQPARCRSSAGSTAGR